ncbi:hypothetical protein SVAN01_11214 [Stagonosporopsis vannaccii]|nr:hypothetical protein SVAN01_11214 [Stagonosporopsis vannaccii]
METKYMPIIQEVVGLHVPGTAILRYTMRCSSVFGDRLGATLASKQRNAPDAPILLVGGPVDLGWDAMLEMSFKDELYLMQGHAVTNSEKRQRIRDAERELTVPEAMEVILMKPVVVISRRTDAMNGKWFCGSLGSKSLFTGTRPKCRSMLTRVQINEVSGKLTENRKSES